jgi:hypothetical protein
MEVEESEHLGQLYLLSFLTFLDTYKDLDIFQNAHELALHIKELFSKNRTFME